MGEKLIPIIVYIALIVLGYKVLGFWGLLGVVSIGWLWNEQAKQGPRNKEDETRTKNFRIERLGTKIKKNESRRHHN